MGAYYRNVIKDEDNSCKVSYVTVKGKRVMQSLFIKVFRELSLCFIFFEWIYIYLTLIVT